MEFIAFNTKKGWLHSFSMLHALGPPKHNLQDPWTLLKSQILQYFFSKWKSNEFYTTNQYSEYEEVYGWDITKLEILIKWNLSKTFDDCQFCPF